MPKGFILIADDNDDLRRLEQDLIVENFPDIEVQTARDGTEAAQVIKDRIRDIRLLLTDFLMPGLKGDAVIQILKGEAQKAGIPVPPFLVLSATPENVPTDLQPYLLRKPFDFSNLLTRIRRALQVSSPPESATNNVGTYLV